MINGIFFYSQQQWLEFCWSMWHAYREGKRIRWDEVGKIGVGMSRSALKSRRDGFGCKTRSRKDSVCGSGSDGKLRRRRIRLGGQTRLVPNGVNVFANCTLLFFAAEASSSKEDNNGIEGMECEAINRWLRCSMIRNSRFERGA